MTLHDLSVIARENRDWLGQLAVGLASIVVSALVADVRAKRTLRKAANRKAVKCLRGLVESPHRLIGRGLDGADLKDCADLATAWSRRSLNAAIARCQAAANARQHDELGQPMLADPQEARAALLALLKELQ